MKQMVVPSLILALASCAKIPAEIPPSPALGDYSRLSCSAAKAKLQTENNQLTALSAAQTKTANADKVSVMLVFAPVSALTGRDQADEIAKSKGRIVALQSRIAQCS